MYTIVNITAATSQTDRWAQEAWHLLAAAEWPPQSQGSAPTQSLRNAAAEGAAGLFPAHTPQAVTQE